MLAHPPLLAPPIVETRAGQSHQTSGTNALAPAPLTTPAGFPPRSPSVPALSHLPQATGAFSPNLQLCERPALARTRLPREKERIRELTVQIDRSQQRHDCWPGPGRQEDLRYGQCLAPREPPGILDRTEGRQCRGEQVNRGVCLM